MKRQSAIIVAGFYWLSVVGSYIGALIVHDQFGFAFMPFLLLSLPWSLLTYGLAEQIPAHGIAAASYAVLCFLLSGFNALLIYFLTRGCSALLSKVAYRWRK